MIQKIINLHCFHLLQSLALDGKSILAARQKMFYLLSQKETN